MATPTKRRYQTEICTTANPAHLIPYKLRTSSSSISTLRISFANSGSTSPDLHISKNGFLGKKLSETEVEESIFHKDVTAKRQRLSGDTILNSKTKDYNEAIDLFQQKRDVLGALKLLLPILYDLRTKQFYYILENECQLGKLTQDSIPTRLSVMLWCLFLKGELKSVGSTMSLHEKGILKTVTYPKLKELLCRFNWLRVSGQEIPISLEYFTCIDDVSLTEVRLIHPSKHMDPMKHSIQVLELNNIHIEDNKHKKHQSFKLHTLLSNLQLRELTVVCSEKSTKIDVKIHDFQCTLEHLYLSGTTVIVGRGKVHLKSIVFDCISNPSVIERVLESCDRLNSLEIIMEKNDSNHTLTFSRHKFIIPSLNILKLENVKFLTSKETNTKLKQLPKLMLTNYPGTLIKDLTVFFKVSEMLIVISNANRLSHNSLLKVLTSMNNNKSSTAPPKSVIHSEVGKDGQSKYIETYSNKSNEINKVAFIAACNCCS